MRGNQRTSGELSRKEGGKIFGSGSRTPIAITILVKKPNSAGTAKIFYHDIGDYLTREDKLRIIKEFGSICNPKMQLSSITPNSDNDWVNQRDGLFETFVPIEPKTKYDLTSKSFFVINSRGLETARDSWVYTSSKNVLTEHVKSMIDFYSSQIGVSQEQISFDASKISWSSSLLSHQLRGTQIDYQPQYITDGIYRPFFKQCLYFGNYLIHRRGQWDDFFPTPQSENKIIVVSGTSSKSFSTLMTNVIPDLHILESGSQCFPLYYYEKQEERQLGLFDKTGEGYIKRDGITDFAFQRAREMYGPKTTKENVFYYVYGLLHSPVYKKRFAPDLTKMLPRIPFVEEVTMFQKIMCIGRKLADLHLNYENAPSWSELLIKGNLNNLHVVKMRFGKAGKDEDRHVIWLNDSLRVENIPLQAYEYIVNGKSALEWLMERYTVTTNSDSGIVNDANKWGLEHDNPRYILDLLGSIVTVSMETLKLISELPRLNFDKA